MPDETRDDSVELEPPVFLQPWPGYWRTHGFIKRAKRLQDLIRHRERWATEIELAQPLEDLFPGMDRVEASQHIEEEIGKLQQVVYWDLNRFAMVNTGVLYKDRYAVEGEPDRKYDLILDYFRLPRRNGEAHQPFEAVMRILNNGIGVFEARKKWAFWEMFNPIHWLAFIIRLPITVMKRAGFGPHNKRSQEMMVGGYAKFVRILMIAILVLVALKYGITVPWKDLWEWLLRLI